MLRIVLILSFALLWPGSPVRGADRCVECHTDAGKLQALVRPPAEIVEEEGEG